VSPLRRLGVESLRDSQDPLVILRHLATPWLVLGSSQSDEVVEAQGAEEVVQRRGGGGAVLLRPDVELWIDVWIPSASSLHRTDVRAQLEVVGAQWRDLLSKLSGVSLSLAEPRPPANADEEICCFLGRGAGEVVVEGEKLVGLAAWRGREGALVQAAVSRRHDTALLGYLSSEAVSAQAAARLESEVTDLAELEIGDVAATEIAEGLARGLSAQMIIRPPEFSLKGSVDS
jgi:lipoate-protein ligase A